MTVHGKVIVVSARFVVRLEVAKVVDQLVIGVPLGTPATSSSILNHRSTDGETNFLRESFIVVNPVPFQINGMAILLFELSYHIFVMFGASTNDGDVSGKTHALSNDAISSHIIYCDCSTRELGVGTSVKSTVHIVRFSSTGSKTRNFLTVGFVKL